MIRSLRGASMRGFASLLLVVLMSGCAVAPFADPRVPGDGSVVETNASNAAPRPVPQSAPAFAPGRLIAADGAALPLRAWLPEAPPRAVILALHGFNDYSNAFAAPGAAWARHGI